MGKLTAVEVKAALKTGKAARLIDGEGLRLTIDSKGRAYWVLRVMVAGKDMERSLGRADTLSLADAREKARETRKELLAGINTTPTPPPVERIIPTFEAAARAHYKAIAPTFRNAKHSAQFLSTLRDYAFPQFGEKPVSDVDESDIVEALLPIWTTKRETAGRVQQRIRAVLASAKGRGWRTTAIDWDSVAAALPKVKKTVKHMPALPFADIPGFHRALAASSSAPVIRAALSFQIISALRPGNIISLRWDHIDRENGIVSIPGDLMKAGVAHRIPLTPGLIAALDIAELRRAKNAELVFPGIDRITPLSPDTLRMTMRRMGLVATPHGFRSSFKDWSLSAGYADHLSERQLAHTDPNEVRRAYARDDLLELRRAMMATWDSFVTGR
jgi:integrase